jgi:hypothetical protein
VILGAVFLLDNLGLGIGGLGGLGPIHADDALNLWPCAIIALGLLRLWNRGFSSVWGQLLTLGGLLCLAGVWWHGAAIEAWWPIPVVWAGLFVAMKAFSPKGADMAARGLPLGWHRSFDGAGTDAIVAIVCSEGGERVL